MTTISGFSAADHFLVAGIGGPGTKPLGGAFEAFRVLIGDGDDIHAGIGLDGNIEGVPIVAAAGAADNCDTILSSHGGIVASAAVYDAWEREKERCDIF